MHPAATKKNHLRRVGAWCTRLIARVSSHPQHKSKDRDAGSPVTENESWITTMQRSQRTRWNSSSDDTFGGDIASSPSTAETDRAPSYLAAAPLCRTRAASTRSHRTHSTASSSSSNISRSNRVSQRTTNSSTTTSSTAASLEDPLRDELSLITSQRLNVAGLYVQAQHIKRKKLRELSYQRSMQMPLNHIQVRRRLYHEKEVTGAGGAITPSFVCIRKAELGRDARRRLKIFGFNADDSVPPWIPSAATAGRWSCELTVGSPRSASAFNLKQLREARVSSEYSSEMRQLQQPPPQAPQSARDAGI